MNSTLDDYKLRCKTALLDKVNKASNVTFTFEDVLISDPYLTNGSPNSAFLIEGKPEGRFKVEGRKEIKFNRLDLADYFAKLKDLELLAKQEKTIHDLLPELNKQSGLYLTEHDLLNGSLPKILPRKPLAPRYVTLEATPHSGSFIGSVTIRLGPNVERVAKSTGSLVFVFDNTLEQYQQLKAYDTSGKTWGLFTFLGNMITSRTFQVDHCRKSNNGYIHLYGSFDITVMTDIGEGILTGNHLTLDITGVVLGCDDTLFIEPEKTYTNPNTQFHYFTEQEGKVMKRYDYAGIVDPSFSPQFAFTIRHITITNNQNLYVVSEPFESRDVNGGGSLYSFSKVFKLKPSGLVDTGFKAITIRNETGLAPTIDDVLEDANGNVYLTISHPNGYSVNALRPYVNGKKLLTTDWTDVVVSPVLKFDAYGALDNNWVTSFDFLAPVIFNPVAGVSPILPIAPLQETKDYLSLLQYKQNGVTGKANVIPTYFSKANGSYVLPKSEILLDSVDWLAVFNVGVIGVDEFVFVGTLSGLSNQLTIVHYELDKIKSISNVPWLPTSKSFCLQFNAADFTA